MKVVGSPDIVTLIDSRRVRLSVCPSVQNASSPVVLVGGAL